MNLLKAMLILTIGKIVNYGISFKGPFKSEDHIIPLNSLNFAVSCYYLHKSLNVGIDEVFQLVICFL